MKHNFLCRVCGANSVEVLPIGFYEAFFRLRVDVKKDKYLMYSSSPLLGGTGLPFILKVVKHFANKFFSKGYGCQPFRTFVQRCEVCHSATPFHEWSYEDLGGLYHDYRSETYNRDRASVERGYANVACDIGNHPAEVANRNAAVEAFLRLNEHHLANGAMLDYGGSDGRFLPPIIYERYAPLHISDPSDAPLHASVDGTKVIKVSKPERDAYSFVACMHVLEHVGNPRDLIQDAVTHLVPGGLIYIEIPLDMTEDLTALFRNRVVDRHVSLHEHINQFDMDGIPALAKSLGNLELIDKAGGIVDFGWTKGLIGRFLLRKTK